MCATYHRGVPVAASPAPPILAAQVARLFFDRQFSKVEIAARLGISRFRVARIIDGALADGLVRIEFRDIPSDDRELAATIEARFGLDLCAVAAVADDGSAAEDNGSVRLARLAGAVIDGLIGPGDVIGIAWGSTLAAVVRQIPARIDGGLEVVQLAGSSVRLGRERDAGELARTLADRLGATHHAIYAPAFVESAGLRQALGREPDVADAVARFGALTLAVVGIGAMPSGEGGPASSLLRSGLLDDTEVARLAALGAVGDLVVHPFDAAGRFVAPDLAERAVAIGVADLRRVRRVVAVAAGVGKAAAIRGALATGLVRILVTDAPTASAVLAGG
jgi:DNA-binding transcriptional regulator LsrR (DeoR family)